MDLIIINQHKEAPLVFHHVAEARLTFTGPENNWESLLHLRREGDELFSKFTLPGGENTITLGGTPVE